MIHMPLMGGMFIKADMKGESAMVLATTFIQMDQSTEGNGKTI